MEFLLVIVCLKVFCNMLERVGWISAHCSLASTVRSGCGSEALVTMHVPFLKHSVQTLVV